MTSTCSRTMVSLGKEWQGILPTCFLLGLLCIGTPASALTNLFFEDFDSLPLNPPVDETFLIGVYNNAFTQVPPLGWNVNSTTVPGRGDPFVGVEEWEGWSFANKDFWIDAAIGPANDDPGGRELFDFGQGTIAVADPDQWNDLGNPANTIGFYNTLMQTPAISLAPVQTLEDRLVLTFQSSWINNGCCDDGALFDPGGNNQTAVIRVRDQGGVIVYEERWESAPFLDNFGDPTNDPMFDQNPNPNFKPTNVNEAVVIDLSFLIQQPPFSLSEGEGEISLNAMGSIGVEFGMEDAGDDGAWGVDTISVSSFTALLGDMNFNASLEVTDIDEFALGMQDEIAYIIANGGLFPSEHGSVDSTFDFGDIPWFVSIMEGAGVASAAEALSEALAGETIPEPSTCLLTLSVGYALLLSKRRI